jgi:Cu-processing system permease protein
MTWLYFALIFDGLVLFLLFQFQDYPIENAMVGITAFSPIDLARIQILLHLDVSAMMGYTGAIFKDFFRNNTRIDNIICTAFTVGYNSVFNFNEKI